ncbi:MAG: molecular chaperone DnaJ [Candidatus Harrisonbacteria bacterium CG10_big_fil_rev_8_21_14_0_10_44_23]|uniref:Molecular chaperone DnaJ n=1 Tax=Candidatus Harrisonbacteria bacterium CG10_big_fil_rev_8_21_14_0_10_44_23 TaxID=1974585 RepID=A0A2H0UPY3_9BACT|nr:MAG: molecular chaperone DnaJ [Candidatus Harrisonbacteria bacterium CG10_big_fil_rev_8_21_14_0_10_44_23]
MADYYKILGLEKNASEEEIKKAYRKLAHQHHPDKGGGDTKKFKELNEAYQVLSNKEKRSQYDKFGRVFDGQPGQNGPGGFNFNQGFNGFEGFDFGNFGDIGDILETFFGGRGFRARAKGADLQVVVQVSLEEAFDGTTKKIQYKTYTGDAGEASIEIPAGVEPGHLIKIAGAGERLKDKPSGDLYVQVQVLPHEKFVRRGADLIYRKELNLLDALLGKKLTIETISGEKVEVEIPMGADLSQPLKIPGRGMPRLGRFGRGDLYVRLQPRTPKKLSRKAKKILKDLEGEIN